MTDDPIKKADTPLPRPPSRVDVLKGFLGDLARPYVLYASATSAFVATLVLPWLARGDLVGAATFIGAAWAGVGGLYWSKSTETVKVSAQAAEVEKAKVNATSPTTTTTTTSPSGAKTVVETPAAPPAPDAPGDVDPTMYGGPRG